MTGEKHQVTIHLTPAQLGALTELAKSEQCEISNLVERGVDTFLATYRASGTGLEAKIDRMHNQTIKLLVGLMKLVGQAIYFSSLPITTGPIKAKLNQEGITLQWHHSEQFAKGLLNAPGPKAKSSKQ